MATQPDTGKGEYYLSVDMNSTCCSKSWMGGCLRWKLSKPINTGIPGLGFLCPEYDKPDLQIYVHTLQTDIVLSI